MDGDMQKPGFPLNNCISIYSHPSKIYSHPSKIDLIESLFVKLRSPGPGQEAQIMSCFWDLEFRLNANAPQQLGQSSLMPEGWLP